MSETTLLKILVVEDDPLTASNITTHLTGLGWSVDFAASGKAALKQQQKQAYDVVLLDTTLPDMCAEHVYSEIKSVTAHPAPVLCLRTCEAPFALQKGDDVIADVSDMKHIISRCQALAAQPSMAISA